MLPDQWLKASPVIKARNKLPSWSRQDFIALAQSEFGKTDLTKQELGALLQKLKDPALQKPATVIELESLVPEDEMPTELVMTPNRGHTNYEQTHWYYASGRADLHFASEQEATLWATTLLFKDTTRANWSRLLEHWQKETDLRHFGVDLYPIKAMDPVLQKVLVKRYGDVKRLTTPLPDNATTKKRYWGLEEGDCLLENGQQAWYVENVRVNMDGPPTVTLHKENA